MSTTITEPVTNTKKKVVSLILTHQARIRCFMDMIMKGKRSEKKESITEKIKNNTTLNNSIIFVKNTINTAQTKIENTISPTENQVKPRIYDYLEKEKEEEEEEKRFKNCSFLRLCVNKETGLCIQLVYGGELDPGEGKGGRTYYITDNIDEENVITTSNNKIRGGAKLSKFVSATSLSKKKDMEAKEEDNDAPTKIIEVIFENINAGINRLHLSNNIFKNVDEYVFYIGRHGQAEHNLKSATHLKTDTDVTQLGKDQEFRAGENLTKILKKNKENINYVFASDLIRTRQTIENILKGMNMNKNENESYFPSEIIILPCSHELKYNSKGLCDKKPSSFSLKIGTKENDPKCSNTTHCVENNITNPESDCNRIQITDENPKNKIIRKIPLNWDFYFEKNENKMRNMDCSKTNMIQLAIEYINTSGPIRFNKNVEINDTQSKSQVVTKIPTPVVQSSNPVQPVEEPVVEESIVEESIVEEPVVEESIVEKPVVKKPVVEESIDEKPKEKKENNIRLWLGLYFNNKKTFYKDIKDLSIRDINVFDEVMDEFLSKPIELIQMIQEYKSKSYGNKNDDIGFIIDYLGVRLKENNENALKFMEYIKSENPDLYHEIEKRKQTGGKKTRKNRKGKKRFLKRTKRNHKKSKTRRIRRKII